MLVCFSKPCVIPVGHPQVSSSHVLPLLFDQGEKSMFQKTLEITKGALFLYEDEEKQYKEQV